MAGSLQPTSATSTGPEVAVELDLPIIFHIVRRSAGVRVLTKPLYPTAAASDPEQM
jgi:hypothetical protein